MPNTKISALTPATTPLAGTEVLPIVQSGSTVKVANNDLRPRQIQSNATSGILQIAGPAAGTTRTMTTPDANFTAARTDAAQSFTGDQTLSTGNLIQGTAAKGVTTGGAFSLGLGTNGSTTQASLDTSGNLKVGSGSALTKLDVAGSIAPTNAPSSNWGLDFAPSTSSGTYITIANNGTYDLATGSGMTFLLDESGNGFTQLASYFGNTYIVWQAGVLYTTASGTAGKVNFFYNAGTGKYRIENKFGSSLNLWVSTFKMRNSS